MPLLLPLLLALVVSVAAWIALYGCRQQWPKTSRREPVTVVVCARDEEDVLMECLFSLSDQTYPRELYSLLLVNHLSKDRTGELMELFAADARVPARVIHIREEDGELRGKVQALDTALRHVDTEFVLLTDADCTVPETWIERMMAGFHEDVAVVNSQVSVEDPHRPNSFLARMQHVLNRLFLALSAGYSTLQLPADQYHPRLRPFRLLLKHLRPSFNMGNNQGLRMSTYREIGGFRTVGPTLIEDVALVNRMIRETDKRIAVLIDPEAVVTTRPSRSFREFWRQTRRWASATKTFNATNSFLYAVVFLMRIAIPWSVLLFPLTGLAAFAIVVAAEVSLIRQADEILEDPIPARDLALHFPVQIAMNHLLLVALVFNWPVIWKGKVYRA
ncbi:MAG: hypothetical protein MAG453_01781 [Calditrichaeota bacterium]|nr:hypothetical protein [Calditrichota bacterium]